MRKVTLILVHCSAVKPDQTSSAKQIDAWHKALGWSGIGYHYVVRRDGTVEKGRDESLVGAHCAGRNRHSIGVCYEGGLEAKGKPADTRTPEQKESLLRLLADLRQRHPQALIMSHHTFNPRKACPCFSAENEYKVLQPK